MTTSETEELLFIGDVHLGRRPVGLDAQLESLGLAAVQLGPEAALARTVDAALAAPPRAVVFAGDLVDQEEDRFEALRILERETRRLSEAGIPVLAIAGNHDGRILPRLVRHVPHVQLLGEGARWQRYEVPGPGRAVDLFGWSFPQRHFADCPLDHGDFAAALAGARPGAARLGVLHADLDAGSSDYAPSPRKRLVEAGLDAWLLGHVHRPSSLDGAQPIGYLGSLVGLDAGEPGLHGAWRVHCGESGVTARQLNVGPLRWAALDVPLTDADTTDDITVLARIEAALAEHAREQELPGTHRVLIARVRLTGALTDRSAVRELTGAVDREPLVLETGLPAILQRTIDETREPVQLDQLAAETTPIGHVARELLVFQSTGELPAAARAAFAEVRDGDWPLEEDSDPLPAIEVLFERAAWRALDVLLAQERERRP